MSAPSESRASPRGDSKAAFCKASTAERMVVGGLPPASATRSATPAAFSMATRTSTCPMESSRPLSIQSGSSAGNSASSGNTERRHDSTIPRSRTTSSPEFLMLVICSVGGRLLPGQFLHPFRLRKREQRVEHQPAGPFGIRAGDANPRELYRAGSDVREHKGIKDLL